MLHIDDPVGAVLAFSESRPWVFGTCYLMFLILKKTMGLRVSPQEEIRGLDIGEHGIESYSGFQVFTTQ